MSNREREQGWHETASFPLQPPPKSVGSNRRTDTTAGAPFSLPLAVWRAWWCWLSRLGCSLSRKFPMCPASRYLLSHWKKKNKKNFNLLTHIFSSNQTMDSCTAATKTSAHKASTVNIRTSDGSLFQALSTMLFLARRQSTTITINGAVSCPSRPVHCFQAIGIDSSDAPGRRLAVKPWLFVLFEGRSHLV